MRAAPRPFHTRDGRSLVIRAGRPADSGRILDHAWRIHSGEPQVNVAEADEVQLTVEHLRGRLERLLDSDNSMLLLAEAGGEVIGTLSVEGGLYRKVRHNAKLGVSVRRTWRRQGIARALMERAVEEAVRGGVLRRLTLAVFADNAPAIRLYESLGFVVEGRRVAGVLIGDRYEDELLMALDLVRAVP